ncbi:MAG TPA: LytR C-terminal domain-containing protein [Egibacteraceae bacterium]|nr:LytR C-terminal domain-containing protein [Egibacteraceae bacterium]
MGRHADPDARHFWRSLAMAGLRALGALALVAGVFAALASIDVDRRSADGPVVLGPPGSDDDETAPAPDPTLPGQADATPPPASDREPTAEGNPDTPRAEPEPEPESPAPDADVLAAAPPPEETTVQVLDGVGGSPHLELLVATLEDLGYTVVATNPARTDYATTTVLFSAGHEDAARALQARDPRVVERRPNSGLSEEVHLHVVLGADWRP